MNLDDTDALRATPAEIVMPALGFAPDEKAKRREGGRGYSYWSNGDEKIIVIEQSRAGCPLWFAHRGDKPRDWFGLVQGIHSGMNLGHAKSFLRRAINGGAGASCPSPLPKPTLALPPAEVPIFCEAPAWSREMLSGRGISCEVIDYTQSLGLLAGFKTETERGKIKNLAFLHSDAQSQTIGAEIRGRTRSFKSFRGAKGMFLLPSLEASTTLAIVESAIDALALATFVQQKGRPQPWIASLAGMPSADQLDMITSLCSELRIERIAACSDNDEAGETIAQRLLDLAADNDMEGVRVRPPEGHKDWADWSQSKNGSVPKVTHNAPQPA